ncbi:class I SAM-dependent methyltransferase [candidate division KSB1 bacterium]|nr:class I SAM-dependent methyltransferase [candidate division KSB1 bacterium]
MSTLQNSFKCIFILIIFVCSINLPIACQWGENPDAWEKRHNENQPPEQVMDSMAVKAGMTIAEIGAGRGRYAVHIARRIGPTGKIYANDIDQDALDYLNFRCKRDKIQNITTIWGTVTDPKLPKSTMDLIYIINTYHHLDDPVGLMKNVFHALKPDGKLVIIEHDPIKINEVSSHTTTQEKLIQQANEAGFKLVKIQTFLKYDNIYYLKADDKKLK